MKTYSDRLFISFSGGETSALMTNWCLSNLKDKYKEIKIVFANTGQEREETLEFIKECDEHFGFDTVWVEAVVHHGQRKASSHKIVDFESASRNGEPFEETIKKYGIPNQAFPSCTRDLKLAPMKSYMRAVGWEAGSYDTAIGIRIDEMDRINPKHEQLKIIYPMVSGAPMTKADVNTFWALQPFRLRLKGYEGNCSWCWKKSLRKHLTLMKERPDLYEFPKRMEALYPNVGPEFSKSNDEMVSKIAAGYKRTFFRGGMSADDLEKMAQTEDFEPASDDHVVYSDFALAGLNLDDSLGGCSEHCEVYHEGDGKDSSMPDFFDEWEDDAAPQEDRGDK